ncbi:MAG: hydroxyacid dehydrogenase [Phycisphaerales bacterium]|nr:hydroxyacid dehydrogenase [Phycisphaerales bacterium]
MKILIADAFESFGVAELGALGAQVSYEPGTKGDALVARLAELDPDVLIVRSTKVTSAAIESAKRLKLIVRAGAGVDNIDIPAASKRGILVSNCPGQNAAAVAELTMGLIIALDRRIPDNVADLRGHKWCKKEYSKRAQGLRGMTIGVVGAGRIGTEVARRALAFEMNVLYFHLGRNRRLADFPTARRTDMDELMRLSDVVTVHVSGGEGTHHLIDERRIRSMKPTALLINTSRGGVVDEAALLSALREGRIRGAALDVFDNEPPADATTIDSPCCDVPNLYGTHHIGASTEEAQRAVAHETVRVVGQYMQTGKAINCVNVQERSNATCILVVRLWNRPGGLAHVFNHLAAASINVEEMDHVIYDGGKAAVAQIRLDKRPDEPVLRRIEEHQNVLGTELIAAD